MRIYDELTESPETLGTFLKGLPVLDAPWDQAFQERFCAECKAENCENCPNEEYRNNPEWWLGLDEKKKADRKLQRLLNADFDGKEFEVVITYENSVKSGSENRQQAID